MRIPAARATSLAPERSGLLQRKCACGKAAGPTGECEECKKKRESGPMLQRKIAQAAAPGRNSAEAPPIVHDVLRAPGQPLDSGTRAFMEPRFGHDFRHVRVHADARAAESARMVNARAYAVGHNVVFGAGQYQPESSSGRRLMAHELAHTIQQAGAVQRTPEQLQTGDPQSQSEHEADTAADAVLRGNTVAISGHTAPQVARQPAPACPGGVKTVSVDLVSLRGSTRDAPADLAFANGVFAPCCIQFTMGNGGTVSAADSDSWLGGDTDLQTGTCGSATTEELNAYNGATAKMKLSSRIRAFYAATISSSSRADSYPPYCATGNAAPLNGMASVSNSAASRSLAHEIGHILLNSPDHPADTANLMHPTNSATDSKLTPAQCATAYANA